MYARIVRVMQRRAGKKTNQKEFIVRGGESLTSFVIASRLVFFNRLPIIIIHKRGHVRGAGDRSDVYRLEHTRTRVCMKETLIIADE